jgi:hypothetical protein
MLLLNALLLQTQVSGTVDTVALGTWVIGGLLSLILILIAFIWQDSKTQADNKHRDLLNLMNKLNDRQDKLEEKQAAQAFQIAALNAVINVIQRKPVNYDNTIPG